MTFFDYLSIFSNVFSIIGIPLLIWNLVRGKFLKARIDGKEIAVPSDEVKESFRRAALAEASRLEGGRRINFSKVEWNGRTLEIDKEKI